MGPQISIITPSFNSENFIADTIESVIAQQFQDWEMLIVDDCSTDNSLEISKRYAERNERITAVQLSENSGAAVARNTAITKARGRYISFLDSDDLWLPHKLKTQIEFMTKNKAAFCFSAYHYIDKNGRIFGQCAVPRQITYRQLLKNPIIGCLTAIYDTQKLGIIEMPLIRKRQDFGLWLRLLKKTQYAYGIQEPLASYRVHQNSMSANKFSAVSYTWSLYRRIEKLPLPASIYCFSHYIVRAFLKRNFGR
jgi:glycosyltransferase involved in cell wall biosynthesis